jgi:two-component system sensor histidine kinase FlrB
VEKEHREIADIELLNQAIEAFNNATVNLQSSYSLLQAEVRKLHIEVEEKNKKLAYTSTLLESVLNNTRCAILVMDDNDNFIIKNQAGEHLISELGEAEVSAMLYSAPKEGSFDYDVSMGRNYRLSVGQLKFENVSGLIFVIDEITELKKLETEKQRGEQLQMMGEMVANIAHEIRNPLGSIELFTSLLERDLKHDENVERLTSNIVKAVRTINGVISNTLLFTKEIHPERAIYPLCDIVDDAVLFLQHLLKEKSVSIINRLDENHLINCDKNLFHQVATNLIQNAIDAVENGIGRIELMSKAEDKVKFTVRDNGHGIAKNMRNRLFMPFQTTKAKGTGLGLSIAYKIVKAHGGDIILDSDGKSYTAFTVVI